MLRGILSMLHHRCIRRRCRHNLLLLGRSSHGRRLRRLHSKSKSRSPSESRRRPLGELLLVLHDVKKVSKLMHKKKEKNEGHQDENDHNKAIKINYQPTDVLEECPSVNLCCCIINTIRHLRLTTRSSLVKPGPPPSDDVPRTPLYTSTSGGPINGGWTTRPTKYEINADHDRVSKNNQTKHRRKLQRTQHSSLIHKEMIHGHGR